MMKTDLIVGLHYYEAFEAGTDLVAAGFAVSEEVVLEEVSFALSLAGLASAVSDLLLALLSAVPLPALLTLYPSLYQPPPFR